MILVLMMAFEISLALALGFVLGRIYQIRHHELERHDGFALPHWTLDEAAEQPATPWRYPQE